MLNPRYALNRKSTLVLAIFAVVLTAISFVSVLAQPYERSSVVDKQIGFKRIVHNGNPLFYAHSGNATKTGLLFIHGTPGGWGAFQRYLANPQLQADFFMVSVDRLGWGGSALPDKRVARDFDAQAKAIKAVFDQYPNKRWIVVGHSLGASIAPQVALMAPEATKSLLLLAGSLKPRLGGPRWYNRAASTWLVASLIGSDMKNSNREIMALRKQLRDMDKAIKSAQLDTDLIIMQGGKDKLVSPKNPAYALEHWQSSFRSLELVELADEGHFLPWRQTPLVIELIYKLNATH